VKVHSSNSGGGKLSPFAIYYVDLGNLFKNLRSNYFLEYLINLFGATVYVIFSLLLNCSNFFKFSSIFYASLLKLFNGINYFLYEEYG